MLDDTALTLPSMSDAETTPAWWLREVTAAAGEGDGPIDAAFHALASIVGTEAALREFNVSAVTGGEDALGDVRVVLDLSQAAYRRVFYLPEPFRIVVDVATLKTREWEYWRLPPNEAAPAPEGGAAPRPGRKAGTRRDDPRQRRLFDEQEPR